MNTISEHLQTPILGKYDVIVCGGGIAGVTAAVSAARQGRSVLLIEKSIQLGGLATIGLISWYEPLCDGNGNRVMNGMTLELLDLCIKYGFHTLDDSWKDGAVHSDSRKRMCTYFSHSLFAMALDSFVLDSGVTILLDTYVTATKVKNNRIEGIFIENKDGRGYYKCSMVVDCTGDADIAIQSGLNYEDGLNYLTYIAYHSDLSMCEEAYTRKNIMNSRKWLNSGSDLFGRGHPEDSPHYLGINATELTDFVIRGRKKLFEKVIKEEPFSRDITVLPSIPQYRKTRRIIGKETLHEEDAGKHFDSSIAALADFTKRGVLYEIPYETLFNEQVENLFVAGRCISSTGWAWDVTRVIPAVAATGQACGTAAALCCELGNSNDSLSIEKLQNELIKQDVWLHF